MTRWSVPDEADKLQGYIRYIRVEGKPIATLERVAILQLNVLELEIFNITTHVCGKNNLHISLFITRYREDKIYR